MCKKIIFIFIILIVLFLLLNKSNYLSRIEPFCPCGKTISDIPDIPENKEGFCSEGCVENFQGGFSKNGLNENFFCPGECNGKRYSTKYLYTQSCNLGTPTINSLNEPYFITTIYN